MKKTTPISLWLSTLYFAKGMPYTIVMVISMVRFWQLGLTHAEITFVVAWFYLPWVLKPLWKPFVDSTLSSRTWFLLTEFLQVATFAVIAFNRLFSLFTLFWFVAWLTAIHNVAVDALYRKMDAEAQQSYLKIREIALKLAVMIGQGVIVMLVGNLQVIFRNDIIRSWSISFCIVSILSLILLFWHCYAVPKDSSCHTTPTNQERSSLQWAKWDFFRKDSKLSLTHIFVLLCFALSQAFCVKVSILFLLDSIHHGGLGLSPQEFALVLGSVGIIALTMGRLLGTRSTYQRGLKRLLWPMTVCVSLPAFVYLLLSIWQPSNLFSICFLISIEQLAFGFGFTAYLAVLRLLPKGEWKKSIMALSFMLPCLSSGLIEEHVGYVTFYAIACALCLPAILSVYFLLHNRQIPIQ